MKINKTINLAKKYYFEIILVFISLIFSSWLMFSTFSYESGSMLIATKTWSDFAGHIPMIRSFSFGDNFPPEYPIFPGEPIRYHFLFYWFVGMLEKTTIPIHFALNIPSIIGFLSLLVVIYFLGFKFFKSKSVGILSIIFFLFNGSLSFLEFFKKYSLSSNIFYDITNNNFFVSFGPYSESIVSAFWNLNIYTNQRHLAGALALSLILIYFLIRPNFTNQKPHFKTGLITGIIFGLSFYFHTAVFLMNVILFLLLFILFSKTRITFFISLIIAGFIALPQYLYLLSGESISKIFINPGYLIFNKLTILEFLKYWFMNLGLHLIFIPLGFLIAPIKAKKILIAFFSLFIVGNLFQFSPEIAANHKFFNLFLIIGSMFSAYFLVFLWKKKQIFKPFVVFFALLLIFSGIIDFFPIYNDGKMLLSDYPKNKDIKWIMENTTPDSIFLNTTYLYNPASLAGRKIFMGWPYFAWSAGYDTDKRGKLMDKIFSGQDKVAVCKLLQQNSIDYIEIKNNSDFNNISNIYAQKFHLDYTNSMNNYYIYNVKKSCSDF